MNWKKRLATIIALAGTITAAIHIINRVITFLSTLDNKLSNDTGHTYNWRFGDIYYTKQGAGSPILLLHSLDNASSCYEWNQIVDKLAETNTVYCLDLLGCGRSDKPMLTYTNFLYVQLVSDFIKDEIGETTDFITSTNSISIATMTALYNKEHVGRIIATNPTDLSALSISPTKRSQVLRFLIKCPIFGTFIYNMLNTKSSIETRFVDKVYYDPSYIEEDEINIYHEAAHIGGISSKYLFASIRGRFTNVNIVPALETLNNSIYILASNTTPNYMTIAEQYKKHNPALEIITLKNTGLLPHLENPTEFVEQVKILFDI